MSRFVLALLVGLAAHGFWPQTGPAPRLAVEPPSVVWIDAGSFVMGASDREIAYAVDLCLRSRPIPIRVFSEDQEGACSPRRFLQEGPRRRAWTTAYGVDRTEVTHQAWRRCVVAGRCPPSRIEDDARLAEPTMPVTGVTFDEAEAYCHFAGGRLPTEEEWERAARGDARHRFPWGRLYNSGLANHGRSPSGPDASDGWPLAAPVGSYPDGASPYGLLDTAGNVWEWTSSAPRDDDVGLGADASVYRVIRGGSWAHPPEVMRVTHRVWLPLGDQRSDVGLRCAYDR